MTNSLTSQSETAMTGRGTHGQSPGETRLRLVLRANALNCIVFGGLLAAIPGTVDELLNTGHPEWVRLVGLGLLPFAALCLWLSNQSAETLIAQTPGIVAGDVGWVLASVVTILLGWYSGGGIAAVVAMAVVVDVFAVLQWSAWRKLRSTR